jgi:prepilin-type N-terminal cleavage/methylation domain-containing protein
MQRRSAFTLIELLVVIAIVAVLAVVVVLVLNPAQLIQQSRDGNRLSDMASLNTALGLYLVDAGTNGTVSLGSASTVYVSIPDPTATSTAGDQCQGLGLPSLPATYSYHCAASSTFRKTDTTGWIPVNFALMSNGSPLGQLPIDPTNSSTSRLWYTYTTNGSQYEITAAPESGKYKLAGTSDAISGDGGTLATVIEKGTKLGLEPLDYGDTSLVGYWTMDEGTGNFAYDDTGTNASGTWVGTATGTSGYYSPGKVGNWAGAFDGTSTYVNAGNGQSLQLSMGTASAWIKNTTSSGFSGIVIKQTAFGIFLNSGLFGTYDWSGPGFLSTGINLSDNTWHFVAFSFQSGVTNGAKVYLDGVLKLTTTVTLTSQALPLTIGAGFAGPGQIFNGLIDDARVYNRVLSAAEIAALYNGAK